MRTLPTFAKANAAPQNIDVFLDGVEQLYVNEADVNAGYVVRYVVVAPPQEGDKFPTFQMDGDEVAMERVEGVVTFAWRDDA